MEAEEDKKPTPTLTIFTFPSVFTNEGDEDLPKSGIRSPGRGEEELGSVQITQEMVNKSLGELKLTQSIREQMATCVRGFYQAGEAMTGQDFSPVHSLEMGETGTRELQSRTSALCIPCKWVRQAPESSSSRWTLTRSIRDCSKTPLL